MTTIKRFTPDYKMHAVRFEAFAREAEHGEYVKFDAHQRAVSALEAERDALAVENAALKKFCKNAAFDADYESELCMERGGFTDTLNNIETPATDAALAAIEARGVEKFAESQKEYVRLHRAELDPMTRAAYCGSAVDAERYAKQLREAK